MPEHPPIADSAPPNPALYSRAVLACYTVLVIGLSHRFVWRVDNRRLHRLYATWTGRTHVEVGPGNGLWLAHLPRRRWPEQLLLLDAHAGPLTASARRLARQVGGLRTHQGDARAPWPASAAGVDSVAASMMVHTLPGGNIAAKTELFEQAHQSLKPGGVFFGATICSGGIGVVHTRLSRLVMGLYQRVGWFDNAGDSRDDLEAALNARFAEVDVVVDGCVAIWTAVRHD